MSRLLLGCLLAGGVIGACTSPCDDRPPGTLEIPVSPGSYRIEAVGELVDGTAQIGADTVVLEFTNPDGARVRVTYDAAEPTWSDDFAR